LVHGNSFTATIQKLEQEKQEAVSDSQKLRENLEQELLNAQREWETERDGLQRELLQWKHAIESHELRFQGMKEKIFPALATLKAHLLEFFDTRDLE
jgi:erythromycin esterase-like protein